MVLAADLPFVDADTVAELLAAIDDRAGALLVDDTGHEQLLVGVWKTDALRRAVPMPARGAPLRDMLAPPEKSRVSVQSGRRPPWWDCATPDDLAAVRERA